MAITFMPVPSVVVRFPVELRAEPSMDLIHEIEPDAREVLLVAECFGLEPPMVDLCDRVDAETARFIAEQVLPLSREERRRALVELLHPVVVAAVAACGMADGMSKRSAAAAGDLLHAQASGGYWLAALEERSNARMMDAAALLIVAYCRCQEAHGVEPCGGDGTAGRGLGARWRGVDLARRGGPGSLRGVTGRARRGCRALPGRHGGLRHQSLRSQRVQAQSRPQRTKGARRP